MIVFPNAKLNLGLRVLGKRADGFHDIESIFVAAPWSDALEVEENKQFTLGDADCRLKISGLEVVGDANQNLVAKAYHLFKEKYPLPPIHIHLLKTVPMGAGLGGGSADGAFMLKLLNSFCELNLSDPELEIYASQLGSDCPFFIRNKPALVTGRGDKITWPEMTLPNHHVLMIHPGMHIPTVEAYSNLNIRNHSGSKSLLEIICSPMENWKENLQNDFEDYAFAKNPAIKELKEALYQHGASYVSMSGSGSALFGLFEQEPDVSWLPQHYIWKLGKL